MNLFPLYKNCAFRFDAEKVHEKTLLLMNKAPFLAQIFNPQRDYSKYKVVDGDLEWGFPMGIAAGLDKNALALEFFYRLGVGSLEIGTVTPNPQTGNPKPRIWRIAEQKSLRNAMGFPNDGPEIIKKRLQSFHKNFPLGINIGKQKETPNEKAADDYKTLYQKFADLGQYLCINVSSPNTPGLRDLQQVEALKEIFQELKAIRKESPSPLFLKVSPDMNLTDLEQVAMLAQEYELSGIVATNTTRREDLGPGGVSGNLLSNKAQTVRNHLLKITKNNANFVIIGAGGISNFEQVKEFWKNGGRLFQVYTSFIYQGPELIKDIRSGIDELLAKTQAKDLIELLENPKEI